MKTTRNVSRILCMSLATVVFCTAVVTLYNTRPKPATSVVCLESVSGKQCFSPGQISLAGLFQ